MISKDEAREIWKNQPTIPLKTPEDAFRPANPHVGCGSQEYKYDWNPGISPIYPNIFPNTDTITVTTTTSAATEPPKTSLSTEDLAEIINLLDMLNYITEGSRLYDVELKVQLDESQVWVVLGYDKDGIPSLLGFE